MSALKIATIGAEVTVISTLAVSSYHIAFSGPSPDWLAGAPILTVVALESMRLPLAFRLPCMRPLGLACGVAMLAGLSVITGEAASLAFENLIFQRTRPVAKPSASWPRPRSIAARSNRPRIGERRRSPDSSPTLNRCAHIGPASTSR